MSKSDITPDENIVLTEEQEWELVDVANHILATGRLNTQQAFDLGAQLARAQSILPPKRFGRWLREKCGYTTKWAKNYTNVHAHLTPYRERLERAAVSPTLMFVMATIEDKSRVETILDTIERGERVTVAKAKAMAALSEGQPLSVEPLETPGREGWRKIAEQRLRAHTATFYELLEPVLAQIQEAAQKFAEGKRVVKAELARAIEYPSRHAHDLFALTVAPYLVAKEDFINWMPSGVDRSTTWGQFQTMIHRLGREEDWPKLQEFRPWIVEEVHPLLRFAVLGEALARDSPVGLAEGHRYDSPSTDVQPSSATDADRPERVALEAPSLASENVVPLDARRRKREAATVE